MRSWCMVDMVMLRVGHDRVNVQTGACYPPSDSLVLLYLLYFRIMQNTFQTIVNMPDHLADECLAAVDD